MGVSVAIGLGVVAVENLQRIANVIRSVQPNLVALPEEAVALDRRAILSVIDLWVPT